MINFRIPELKRALKGFMPSLTLNTCNITCDCKDKIPVKFLDPDGDPDHYHKKTSGLCAILDIFIKLN